MRIRAALRAVPLLARALGLVGEVPTSGWRDVELADGVRGHRWDPPRAVTGPPVLLAAGVTPQGPDDPRVRRLAGALAAAGRAVFVPHMALSDRQLTTDDVDHLVTAIEALDDGGGVVAVGFSFGGAYSLIAAADPGAARSLRAVASFGAYADLLGFLATARSRLFDAEELVAAQDLTSAEQQRVLEVLGGGDIDQLPERVLDLARRLSPASYAGRVEVPVLLLHATGDPTVPDRELHALAEAFPHAAVHTVEVFTHVDLVADLRQLPRLVGDLWSVWRYATAILGA
ncbi:MAG: hypothetical protein KY437_02335 [Actinobacteria bacterium]|nr:hypothetical protein [Actinomycetota bacterium]